MFYPRICGCDLSTLVNNFLRYHPEGPDYNSRVIVRAKSSLILVGLLLILLPILAIFQYRWIGEVSASEHDRLESSLRIASDRFATDFDAEFSRIGSAFQVRDGFPETGAPIRERYLTWSETNPYPRIIHAIYLL